MNADVGKVFSQQAKLMWESFMRATVGCIQGLFPQSLNLMTVLEHVKKNRFLFVLLLDRFSQQISTFRKKIARGGDDSVMAATHGFALGCLSGLFCRRLAGRGYG